MSRQSATLPWSDGAAGPLLSLLADVRDLDWMDRALCAETDPDAFFPEMGGHTRAPIKICEGCEVRAECLEYALKHSGYYDVGAYGIWGATSANEREAILKARAAERSAA